MSQRVAPQSEATGCLPAVVRLTWLIAGNIALFFLAISIAERRVLSSLDLLFWATVATLIVLRYIDITRLNGETKDCELATLSHWRRYDAMLLLASGALWALAHLILPKVMSP